MTIEDNIKHIKENLDKTKLIAVSKNHDKSKVIEAINSGHKIFGENKVQEAKAKFSDVSGIELHLIGGLQSNKVKDAVKIFDVIQTIDRKKIAKLVKDESVKLNKNIRCFIQVNIGNEEQKSGIRSDELEELINYCKGINLQIDGLMCIPPIENIEQYFKQMQELTKKYKLNDLSMGMSQDYKLALNYGSTYIRVGTAIFGNRYA